jgi:hypothetical protein
LPSSLYFINYDREDSGCVNVPKIRLHTQNGPHKNFSCSDFCYSEALCQKIYILSTPDFFTELAEKFCHALATQWLAVLAGACREGGGDERAAGEGRQGRPQG